MNYDKAELEKALRDAAGIHASVEVNQTYVVVSGMVQTAGEQQAALDTLRERLPGVEIVDNLIIDSVLPEDVGDLHLSQGEVQGFPGAEPGTVDTERLEPGDFTDQDLLLDPTSSAGPSGTHPDDELNEGDRVYVPPSDPVRTAEGEFLGGFQATAMDDNEVPRSEVTPGVADEAIIEAVLTELHQDSSTSTLDIEVTSEQGVVYLDGVVGDMDDAENAAAVAERVPGVVEVRDRLEVTAI